MRSILTCSALALTLVASLGLAGALGRVDQVFPGFLVMENGVVASAGLDTWPATRDGSLYQREIVTVDGRPFQGTAALQSDLAALPIGTPVTYGFRQDGKIEERTITTLRFAWVDFLRLYGAYFLNGVMLGLAALVLIRRLDQHPGAEAAAPLLFVASVWALSAMDLYGPHRLFRIHALAESLLFGAALHLAIGFPRPWWAARRYHWIRTMPYAAALVLAVAYQAGLSDPAAYARWHLAAIGALGGALLALIASQILRFWVARPAIRREIEVIALGSLLSLAPAVWLSIAEPWTGGSSPQNAMAITAFIFPMSIAWAVLRGGELESRGTGATG